MLGIIKSKFRSKKAIHACLFLGIILLIAIFCSYPMFENGADNSILNNLYQKFANEEKLHPGAVLRKAYYSTELMQQENITSLDQIIADMDAHEETWKKNVEIPLLDRQRALSAELRGGNTDYAMRGRITDLRYVENLSEHIVMLSGVTLEEAEVKTGSGGKKYYPVIINSQAVDYYKVITGEEMVFNRNNENPDDDVCLYVAGVFEKKSADDPFWELDYASSSTTMLTTKDVLNTAMFEYNLDGINYSLVNIFDVRYLTANKVSRVYRGLDRITKADESFKDNIRIALKSYSKDAATITTLLNVLVFPTLALILFFIVMISSQIIKGEESEIAVLRSRGRSRLFVIWSYIVEGFVSVVICYLPGLGLGYLLGKIMAHCDSFLHFIKTDTSYYMFDVRMFYFALVACALAVVCFTVPVIKSSKLTIVIQKAQNPYSNKKAFWEKIFLDVILLGVSIYLLKTNLDKKEALAESVILGKDLDPVLFVSYSLFILACGLVFLRLVKYLITLIDKIGKKKWKPAVYASFLQIRRTFRAQSIISIFVILTIGSGVFYASLAGTISNNTKKRTTYENGADAVVKSYWPLTITSPKGEGSTSEIITYYEEPEISIYDEMTKAGLIESYANVVIDNNATINKGGAPYQIATFMAVNTQKFGETASLIDGKSNVAWYNALNELSQVRDGVIISKNFADKYDVKVGDMVEVVKDITKGNTPATHMFMLEVAAIVDAFPGYERYQYKVSDSQEFERDDTCLAVINYAHFVQYAGIMPYEVWMKYGKNGNADSIRKLCKDNKVTLVKEAYIDELNDQVRTNVKNVLTYGMFTMSFIIALIASGIGLVLFWGMSVNDRSLVFGVFRAMGLKKRELSKMLLLEQIFTTGMAILGGAIIGLVTVAVFVKLVVVVYLPKTSIIPMVVTFDPVNVLTIVVTVSIFMIICWYVMRYLIKKLKIVDAIKIGED